VRERCASALVPAAQELFANPAFRPDGLKLYPTLVIRGTGTWIPPAVRSGGQTVADLPPCSSLRWGPPAPGLYELWRSGRYKNYPPEVLVDLVAKILALVPPWTRVYRVQRCERCGNVADRLWRLGLTPTSHKSVLPWWTALGTFPCRW